jgi:hypothetical protein
VVLKDIAGLSQLEIVDAMGLRDRGRPAADRDGPLPRVMRPRHFAFR